MELGATRAGGGVSGSPQKIHTSSSRCFSETTSLSGESPERFNHMKVDKTSTHQSCALPSYPACSPAASTASPYAGAGCCCWRAQDEGRLRVNGRGGLTRSNVGGVRTPV